MFVVVKNAGGAVVHLPGADETASEITWNPDYTGLSFGGQSGASNDFGTALTTLPYYCDHDPNAGNDQFDTFVAGARGYDVDAGAVYVFGCSRTSGGTPLEPVLRRRVTHWQPQARYGKSIAGFRAMSQIGSGEMEVYLAIGTPGFESGGVKTGKVYLDKFSPTGHKTFVASYSPDGTAGDDKFGLSIAVFQGANSVFSTAVLCTSPWACHAPKTAVAPKAEGSTCGAPSERREATRSSGRPPQPHRACASASASSRSTVIRPVGALRYPHPKRPSTAKVVPGG